MAAATTRCRGNAADNFLDGGPGHDRIVGKRGQDRLRGGPGRDRLIARDGEPDAIRCGTKRDFAWIDRGDEVVSALSDSCERLRVGRARKRKRR